MFSSFKTETSETLAPREKIKKAKVSHTEVIEDEICFREMIFGYKENCLRLSNETKKIILNEIKNVNYVVSKKAELSLSKLQKADILIKNLFKRNSEEYFMLKQMWLAKGKKSLSIKEIHSIFKKLKDKNIFLMEKTDSSIEKIFIEEHLYDENWIDNLPIIKNLNRLKELKMTVDMNNKFKFLLLDKFYKSKRGFELFGNKEILAKLRLDNFEEYKTFIQFCKDFSKVRYDHKKEVPVYLSDMWNSEITNIKSNLNDSKDLKVAILEYKGFNPAYFKNNFKYEEELVINHIDWKVLETLRNYAIKVVKLDESVINSLMYEEVHEDYKELFHFYSLDKDVLKKMYEYKKNLTLLESNSVDIVDTVDSVDIVDSVDTVGIVDTVDTVGIVDSVGIVDTVGIEYAKKIQKSYDIIHAMKVQNYEKFLHLSSELYRNALRTFFLKIIKSHENEREFINWLKTKKGPNGKLNLSEIISKVEHPLEETKLLLEEKPLSWIEKIEIQILSGKTAKPVKKAIVDVVDYLIKDNNEYIGFEVDKIILEVAAKDRLENLNFTKERYWETKWNYMNKDSFEERRDILNILEEEYIENDNLPGTGDLVAYVENGEYVSVLESIVTGIPF